MKPLQEMSVQGRFFFSGGETPRFRTGWRDNLDMVLFVWVKQY